LELANRFCFFGAINEGIGKHFAQSMVALGALEYPVFLCARGAAEVSGEAGHAPR
jgi:hypothetical protein